MLVRAIRGNVALFYNGRNCRNIPAGLAQQEPTHARKGNLSSGLVVVHEPVPGAVDEGPELQRVPAPRVKQVVAPGKGILLVRGWGRDFRPPGRQAHDADL